MSALAKSDLFTPLFALDRLNSWLRADKPIFCPFTSALKPIIYWTKTHAILDASKRWHIEMRRVMVKKKCRRCEGTGSWISWWADRGYGEGELSMEEWRANYGERCRGCSGTGIATLKFVETQIGPIRWHTPADKWRSSSMDVYVPFPSYAHDGEEHYELAQDWEPLQKGRSQPLDRVEQDMLILLDAYPHEVCFAIEFHHRIGCQSHYRTSDIPKARRWIWNLFRPAEMVQV